MSPAVAPEPSAPFGLWAGGQVTPNAHCFLQGNPNPMTLDGTNTWVLLAPGGTEAIVIDPGEDEAAHQQRVVDHVTSLGARVTRIVLTHGHADHSEGAPRMARLTLGGSELDGLHTYAADDHVRVVFPFEDGSRADPVPNDRRMLDWPRPMPPTRQYTIRRYDAQAGEVDLGREGDLGAGRHPVPGRALEAHIAHGDLGPHQAHACLPLGERPGQRGIRGEGARGTSGREVEVGDVVAHHPGGGDLRGDPHQGGADLRHPAALHPARVALVEQRRDLLLEDLVQRPGLDPVALDRRPWRRPVQRSLRPCFRTLRRPGPSKAGGAARDPAKL